MPAPTARDAARATIWVPIPMTPVRAIHPLFVPHTEFCRLRPPQPLYRRWYAAITIVAGITIPVTARELRLPALP